jgi:predicted ATPase
MISRVHVQNFRCLRDVQIELEPLTILVGPNASGKSTILNALDPDANLATLDARWQKNESREIWVSVELEDGSERGKISKSPGSQSQDSTHTYQKLHLDLAALRQPNPPAEQNALTENGDNLSNVFASLTRSEQIEMAGTLCALVPVFGDVDLKPFKGGKLELRFHDRWKKDVFYRPDEVSDGTMLMLTFLILQYQSPPLDLIAIEEPERALHPYLLGQLMQFLRDLAHGEFSRKPIQVVLATHSAELLDHALPNEVRFVDRDPDDGATFIRKPPVDGEDWDEIMDVYAESLGSAWLSGGLGGVPGR